MDYIHLSPEKEKLFKDMRTVYNELSIVRDKDLIKEYCLRNDSLPSSKLSFNIESSITYEMNLLDPSDLKHLIDPDEHLDIYVSAAVENFLEYALNPSDSDLVKNIVADRCLFPGGNFNIDAKYVDMSCDMYLLVIVMGWKYMSKLSEDEKAIKTANELVDHLFNYMELKTLIGFLLHMGNPRIMEYSYIKFVPFSEIEDNPDCKEYEWMKKRRRHIKNKDPLLVTTCFTYVSHMVANRSCLLSNGMALFFLDDYVEQSMLFKGVKPHKGIFGTQLSKYKERAEEKVVEWLESYDCKLVDLIENAEMYISKYTGERVSLSEKKFIHIRGAPLDMNMLSKNLVSNVFPPCVNRVLSVFKKTSHITYNMKLFLTRFMYEIGVNKERWKDIVTGVYKDPLGDKYRRNQIDGMYKKENFIGKQCSYPIKHGFCPFKNRLPWDVDMIKIVYDVSYSEAQMLTGASKGVKIKCGDCMHCVRSKKTIKPKSFTFEQVNPLSCHLYLNEHIPDIEDIKLPEIIPLREPILTTSSNSSFSTLSSVSSKRAVTCSQKAKPLPRIGREWKKELNSRDKQVDPCDTSRSEYT